MYTRHGTRARVITLAALAAFTGLGCQSTHFQRAFRKRVDRAGGWVGGSSPRSKNGGKRRKSAIRARRMNNSGNGNHWSRKHA
jgi:hypothetical protein